MGFTKREKELLLQAMTPNTASGELEKQTRLAIETIRKRLLKSKEMKFIVDDATKEVLFVGKSQYDCELKLTYYLNHEHDAYLSDSEEGYKRTEFTEGETV